MRKVIMIQGAYGYRKEGSRLVTTKTPKDDPFELPETEAARLVDLKVAAYVDGQETQSKPIAMAPEGDNHNDPGKPLSDGNVGSSGDDGDDDGKPIYDADMHKNVLLVLLKDAGISFRAGMTKEDMVAALDKHYETAADDDDGDGDGSGDDEDMDDEEDADGDDGDGPPSLGAAEPVT